MGLSHHERIQKVIWSIHNISQAGKQIQVKYFECELIRFKQLCENLWGVFYSMGSNGGFWLMGSDESVQSDTNTLWSIGVYHQIKSINERELKRDSILDDYLQIEHILPHTYQQVYTVYLHLQNIQYAVNRYDDDFSQRYKPLLEYCGKLYGEIFNFFQDRIEFPRAYLIHKIAELLYKETWESKRTTWDTVTTFLVDSNAHHDLRKEHDIELLRDCYKQLVKNKSSKTRMLVYLRLSRLAYSHQWKKVFAVAKKEKWGMKPLYREKREIEKKIKQKALEKTSLFKEDKEYYINELIN